MNEELLVTFRAAPIDDREKLHELVRGAARRRPGISTAEAGVSTTRNPSDKIGQKRRTEAPDGKTGRKTIDRDLDQAPKRGDLDQIRDLDHSLDGAEKRIVDLVGKDPSATYASLARECNCSVPTIQRKIRELQRKRIIRRVGPDRGGHWEAL